jgi:hypothetical protein
MCWWILYGLVVVTFGGGGDTPRVSRRLVSPGFPSSLSFFFPFSRTVFFRLLLSCGPPTHGGAREPFGLFPRALVPVLLVDPLPLFPLLFWWRRRHAAGLETARESWVSLFAFLFFPFLSNGCSSLSAPSVKVRARSRKREKLKAEGRTLHMRAKDRHLLCLRISSLPPPATRTLRPQLGSKESSLT